MRLIRRVADDAGLKPPTDAQLVERFTTHGDGAAFEALLHRHGPVVWALCRRVLGDSPDAEDAFQATFLVLVRKGRSMDRPELVGNWLYGVAWRTARKARAAVARKQVWEKPLGDVAAPMPDADAPWHELLPVLDEEVNRLPDKYRLPVVLCYFCGQTYAEAARTLDLAEGTVASRLARARERLRRRLSRGGTPLTGEVIAAALSQATAPAAPPAALVGATAETAQALASGAALGCGLSANVISLTEEVLQSMFIAKLKMMAGVVLALGIVGTGTGVWWRGAVAQPQRDDPVAQAGQPQAGGGGGRAPHLPTPSNQAGIGVPPRPARGSPTPATGTKEASLPASLTTAQLRQQLDQRVDLEIENGPLTDALAHLAEHYNIPIVVDSEAFRNDLGMNDIRSQEVRLPKVGGARLRMALRLLLSQIQGDFQMRDGVLFIIPNTRVTSGLVLQQPVDASFHQIPLNVALEKLSNLTGVSVILDVRTAEKAQVAITADVDNVPLEDAVRILADMAGLRPVALENVLYVTTPLNAAKMTAEEASHPRPRARAVAGGA
jgi:RNA polymerase sigma factor (sigma-70 family)